MRQYFLQDCEGEHPHKIIITVDDPHFDEKVPSVIPQQMQGKKQAIAYSCIRNSNFCSNLSVDIAIEAFSDKFHRQIFSK